MKNAISLVVLSGSLSFTFGCAAPTSRARLTEAPEGFTRQEYLRGSVTPEREWWDVLHYDLTLQVFPERKYLKGSNVIAFQTASSGERMQVDLQPPLSITKVMHGTSELTFEREGNAYWIQFANALPKAVNDEIEVFYEGTPVESENPPWSGGLTWDTDELGNPFIATTCQGIGASIWWPNKDHGADEPDNGMDLRITVPDSLVAVCNGRLIERQVDDETKTASFHWQVTNPINNYGVNLNIGNYVSMPGSYDGESGQLDLEYWVLEHQVEQATAQFKEVPRTLAAFEHWFGPYPFYEDSYKLVVVPYLGMEHQSSVTYGNGFQNGYRGSDLSKTGVGLKFDFIIVHETAHEWFGNNVSAKDGADLWIHESFANYAENLFVDYHFGSEEAADYVIGCRAIIQNDKPIIGTYGVNSQGSSDMYYKGGNMLHMMRNVVNDDVRWRTVLRGVSEGFWHETVTTEEFEGRFSDLAGFDFSKLFDQYLRTTKIPLLKYEAVDSGVAVHFENIVPDFSMPVLLHINGEPHRVEVSDQPHRIELGSELMTFELDRNYYMIAQAK
ncbi:MAG: aminopeptidase N [Planctomycetota bacterium]|jgi:aminopeptidase N